MVETNEGEGAAATTATASTTKSSSASVASNDNDTATAAAAVGETPTMTKSTTTAATKSDDTEKVENKIVDKVIDDTNKGVIDKVIEVKMTPTTDMAVAPPTTPSKEPKKIKKKGHKHTQSKQIPYIPAANEKSKNSEDASTTSKDDDRIRLGICAMDKKARSKPMAEILSRLDEEVFHVVFFGDEVILNQPIEEWPICHVLVAFYSKGYPLDKAMQYVELRKPFTLNDLPTQKLLMDRRKVYDLLEGSGIDVPRVSSGRDMYMWNGGNNEKYCSANHESIFHLLYSYDISTSI